MDGREEFLPTPTEANASFDGEVGAGLDPAGQVRSPLGSTGIVDGRDGLRHAAVDAPGGSGGGGVIDGPGSDSSPRGLARGAEHAGPAGRGGEVDPLVREREPVRDMAADRVVPRAGGDMLGGMVFPAALLAMQVGALRLITDLDAPWPSQLGAFLIWLAGCAAFFLSQH